MAEIIRIDSNTWRIEDGFVRFFLLEGEEKAALIDSGVSCPNASELARTLTGKPLILINTHGDGDHTSGTNGFSEIYIHPSDYIGCEVMNRYPNTSMIPINDGDVIDLGKRLLKMIHIPGHTKGSVAILDTAKRVLFAGDSVQKGHIYMFGTKRCPEQFEKSLDKLIDIKSEFDYIYASHDSFILSSDYVEKVKATWKQVQNGEISYEKLDLFGNVVKSFTTPVCGFYMD